MRAVRIGGRLRRLRQEMRLNQAQMAAELNISPSYLNLLESNQRPVTVNILLRLAERFHVDLKSLGGEDDARLTSDLMEALADPLFEGQDVKTSDVRDLVSTLPSVGKALVALYHAYQRGGAAAANRSDDMDGESPGSALPSEEVTDFLQRRMNHFPELEECAETLWVENGLALFTLQQDLVKVLNQRFAVDVEIAPAATLPGLLRSYNPLTRRLVLSEMLPLSSRTFQLAHQIAYLGYRREIETVVSGGKFSTAEADSLARSALANYFAAAVMAPYGRFLEAARSTRYDLDTLQHRFGISFEQACHRLTTLRRPGAEGIPFHLIRVDIAGNISKRFSASGIHIARFGAACPRWNVYDAFATPGMLRVQVSQMPEGTAFFCVARTISTAGRLISRGGLPNRVGQLSIGLGCAAHYARDIVYADGLNLDDPQIVTPIGVSCRTCPRTDCADRAMPSMAQRLEIDENRRGLSTYALAV
ncbi:MAG TPA: short-chain fatty acyl-CoA regulator family protein [Beijerinckiaceae bacterium]|nr:short-chain fatty acyl-CoA regulator family protein [Beijerinckiaceae bacterium]